MSNLSMSGDQNLNPNEEQHPHKDEILRIEHERPSSVSLPCPLQYQGNFTEDTVNVNQPDNTDKIQNNNLNH